MTGSASGGNSPETAPAGPPTSLIICSRERPELLYETVESVLAGSQLPAEIVVIDQSRLPNARLEGLSRSEAATAVRYIQSAGRGLSHALNSGIRAARHDVLVFTHDDVSVHRDWYRHLVAALLRSPEHVVVTGCVLPEPGQRSGEWVVLSTKTTPEPQRFSGRINDDVLYPMNMAMHRRTYDAVGPFDERLGPGTPYPAAEDNDYGYRLLEAGITIDYVPEAIVYHRAWRNDVSALRWAYALGQGGFYAKHLRIADSYMARRAARELARYLGLALRYARQRDSRARWYAASAAGLVSGLAGWTFAHRLGLRRR